MTVKGLILKPRRVQNSQNGALFIYLPRLWTKHLNIQKGSLLQTVLMDNKLILEVTDGNNQP
jgi:hypothetical protein